MREADWLYLFSSNASPQYAQDILNVLAGPPGQLYAFRYEDRWIDDATRKDWRKIGEYRKPVLVCFSLQQQAGYQDAAFIPVRLGQVVMTESIGSHCFVKFTLGSYVSLPAPTSDKDEEYAAKVRECTRQLSELCATPYTSSASLGKPIPSPGTGASWIDLSSPQPLLFERTTAYLARTESFRDARFLRFQKLLTREPNGAEITLDEDTSVFTLKAGTTYELRLLQNQPKHVVDRTRFTVAADGTIVEVIGEPGFDIASSYDQIPIEIHAASSKEFGVRETVLIIQPQSGLDGPRLELPCRVVASAKTAAAVTGLTTIGLILIGVTAVLSLPTEWKATFVVIGSLLAAYMQMYGFGMPTPPTF